ncbi:integration host factor subunit beta [candidate division WOR-3 bacterium]|nr:integration host factor subunit beta [candidate division WOR-3 bacterium]
MTKSDIVDRIVERTGIEKKDVALVINEFIYVVQDSIKSEDRIELRGLGVFKNKHRKGRITRNPKTQQEVEIPDRLVPVFKPSKILRRILNENK